MIDRANLEGCVVDQVDDRHRHSSRVGSQGGEQGRQPVEANLDDQYS